TKHRGNFRVTENRGMSKTYVPLATLLAVMFQCQTFAQDERQAIGEIGSPTISTIVLRGAPYSLEIDDLLQRGITAAAAAHPNRHVDTTGALLVNAAGRLTLALPLIPETRVPSESAMDFLIVSVDRVIHAKANISDTRLDRQS